MTEKSKMWIHLSSQILSNQLSFGNSEPGKHNAIVTAITQESAGKILNSFFKRKILHKHTKKACYYNS